jgi:hypothetical protein
VRTIVIGATGNAGAASAHDEAAVRALGDSFAKAFVQKNAEVRASLFAQLGQSAGIRAITEFESLSWDDLRSG